MDERIITNEKLNEDIDSNIRPNSIDEYIGQTEVKENLNIFSYCKAIPISHSNFPKITPEHVAYNQKQFL